MINLVLISDLNIPKYGNTCYNFLVQKASFSYYEKNISNFVITL